MIRIPPWLLIVVAVWVLAFGAFRFYLARDRRRKRDPDRPNFRKKGFYAQSPRRHMFFGVLYLLMGAVLVAMALGWKPPILGQGCDDDAPTPATESDTTIEVAPASE